MAGEQEYVLGTHDAEIERLGIQHRVWRPRMLDAWRRAGFTIGQSLLDIGCGPGYAAIDLAEIVGPTGHVTALDKSPRFLKILDEHTKQRGLKITTAEVDFDNAELPKIVTDGAWCRWILAFVKQPRELLAQIASRLGPRGVIVIHEYLDYRTWRLMPRVPELEDFVASVISSWRSSGGEPDIGRNVPHWLHELGYDIQEIRPIVDVVSPADYIWQWPKSFVGTGTHRLAELGVITPQQADEIGSAFAKAEVAPHTMMVTPTVIEVVARRR